MAHTVDEDLAAVTAADAGADSIIAYVATLKQQLTAALAGESISAATQEKLDRIFDLSTGTATKVAAAVNTNP